MVRLSDSQRKVLVQAIPAVANLAVGTLVFGQFLRQLPISYALALVGMGIWFGFIWLTVVLAGGKQ